MMTAEEIHIRVEIACGLGRQLRNMGTPQGPERVTPCRSGRVRQGMRNCR